MKKGGIIVCIVLISILGISFVSANWFTDLFTIGEESELEGWLASLSGEGVRWVDGETTTLNIGGRSHEISVVIEDTNTAVITVDGITKSMGEGWTGDIGELTVYIQKVYAPNVVGTERYVELVLGSNLINKCDELSEETKGTIDELLEDGETVVLREGDAVYRRGFFVTESGYGGQVWEIRDIELGSQPEITLEEQKEGSANIQITLLDEGDYYSGVFTLKSGVTAFMKVYPGIDVYDSYSHYIKVTDLFDGISTYEGCNHGSNTGCIDSDIGKGYYESGYVEMIDNPDFGENGRKYDVCWEDGKNLQEYVCKNGVYEGDVSYYCPQGCANGACVFENNLEPGDCYDSDAGKISGVMGITYDHGEQFLSQDLCSGNVLTEYYCAYESQTDTYYRDKIDFNCYIGCDDGACIQDGLLPEGFACCEKTNQGWGCYETLEKECNTDYQMTPVKCEQTSYCKPGCCYDTKYGYCEYYSTQSQCTENEGTWSDNPNCEIPECTRGCCNLGNQFSFMTESRCELEAGYMGLPVDFDSSITNELTCITQGPLRINYAGPNWESLVYELPAEINIYADTSKPATCEWGFVNGERTQFFYTGEGYHSQTLDLEEGDYEYEIYCLTADGEKATTIISFSVKLNEEGVVNVEMTKGWNLILGFVEPWQILSGDVVYDDVKAIYALMPNVQEYARAYPEPEWEKLQTIDEDYILNNGFWVYSDKAGIMKYRLYEETIPFNQRPIYSGWNFVGITNDMMQEDSEEELKNLVGDCNIEKSYFFNSITQEWQAVPLTEKFETSTLGYTWVIKVSGDCYLGRNENIIAPPLLPDVGGSGDETGAPLSIKNFILQEEYSNPEQCEEINGQSDLGIFVNETGELCMRGITLQYWDSNGDKVIFVHLSEYIKGFDFVQRYLNYYGTEANIGKEKVYRFEKHELFWYPGNEYNIVYIQEATRTEREDGVSYRYDHDATDNSVVDWFYNKYSPIIVA